jgi:hypothetical protein
MSSAQRRRRAGTLISPTRSVWAAMTPTRSEPGAPPCQPWLRGSEAQQPAQQPKSDSRSRLERVEAQRVMAEIQRGDDVDPERQRWASDVLGAAFNPTVCQ